MQRWYIAALIIFVGLISCQNEQQKITRFEQGAEAIQEKYIPDRSLAVFEAELKYENGTWSLDGESDVPQTKDAAVALADSILGRNGYKNNFQLLPETALGDSIYAITSVSVANIRREPRHSAELVDQSIMGRPLKLLKRHRGWYLIQTHYNYIGYMQRGQLERMDKASLDEWYKGESVRVTDLSGRIFSNPTERSFPVSDYVINMQLKKTGSQGSWIEVLLPDGQTGYIKSENVEAAENNSLNSLENILITARSMLGVPYLWGGNSSKGNDCSGFTQTVFNANGLQLPRDARQQALVGEEIIPDETFSNVQPGDLLFFGSDKRITHVGISLGGDEFIHQASYVHISSLNENKDNFSAYRKRGFQKIKRVVNVKN